MNTLQEMLNEDLLNKDPWARLLKKANRYSDYWLRESMGMFEAADLFPEKYLEMRNKGWSDEKILEYVDKRLSTILKHKKTDIWRQHVLQKKSRQKNKSPD